MPAAVEFLLWIVGPLLALMLLGGAGVYFCFEAATDVVIGEKDDE